MFYLFIIIIIIIIITIIIINIFFLCVGTGLSSLSRLSVPEKRSVVLIIMMHLLANYT